MKMIMLTLCFVSSILFAGDHPMTKIIGTNIDLSMKGHSFSGEVNDKIIYGRIHGAGHKTADILIDDSKLVTKAKFERTNESFGGVLIKDNREITLNFVKVIKTDEQEAIVIAINGVEHIVDIQADGFEHNHFINPSFSTVINGEEISFKVMNGESCWMNSIQLVFSILGSYLY